VLAKRENNEYFLLTSQYEFTPFEFGSWTGRVQAFAELDYLGTTLYGGDPVNTTLCVLGYDAATFLGGITTAAINFCESGRGPTVIAGHCWT
jgi:hypothetical protein